MKRFLTLLVALAFCVPFLWRCANILSLEGGPRDSIPPRIVNVEPLDYSTNFTAKSIFIEFDEFVTLKDQQKEFFTSPRMKKTPQLTIRGRGVVIRIQDTLLDNTTYALNFGSTICDNNEGNPFNGLRYVFSTGPEVDSMVVSGYTEDAFKADSVSKSFVYFFPVETLDSLAFTREYDSVMLKRDTAGVLIYNPAVIARAEKNGIFLAQNLKPIPYRIYAFEDTNSNMIYEASIDKIGFIDEPQNPLELHDFGVWYDSLRMYVTGQPQLYFRMFTDETFKMQNLREMSRPRQHQAQLIFNAPYPQIDSIVFDSLPREKILIESLARQRDTLALWFDAPGAELPDTLKGRIAYRQWNDSLKGLIPATRDLRLAWRAAPETREQERERKKLEEEREAALEEGTEWVEPQKPSLFKHTLTPQGGTVTPETELYITFDMPLTTMDTTLVVMREIVDKDARGNKIEKPDTMQIPVRWSRDLSFDSMQLRRWRMGVTWKERATYQLTFQKGSFEDIAREKNDSTTVSFTGIDPDKVSTFVVDVKGKTPDARYIVQLLDGSSRLLQEKTNVGTERITFRYVAPGEVKFRATEDTNANGRWDTGNLVEHRQPERTEYYIDPKTGEDLFVAKENWHFDNIVMDMNVVFAPITVERLWETLDQRERARLEKEAEERAKRR